MLKGYSLTQKTDELKKLILENPDMPIVVLAGEDANDGYYGWMFCSSVSFHIEEILDYRATHHVSFPCTLNPTLKDALYLPQSNLVITSQSDGEIDSGEIDSEDLFSLSVVDIDQIKKAKKIREEALEEAKRWFGVASDMHFRLEKIYGEAMNFDVNEGILEQKATEISIILEKER